MQSLLREAAAVSAAVEAAALERSERNRLSLATLHVGPGLMLDAAPFFPQPPALGPQPALERGGASHEAAAPWQTPSSSGQERHQTGRPALADSAASMPQQRPWHDGRTGAWHSSAEGSPDRWTLDQRQHPLELSVQAVQDASEDSPEPRQLKRPKPWHGAGVGAGPQPPLGALHHPGRHAVPAASPAARSAGA